MKFTVTVDKKVQARIDAGRCVNCGECGEICPTGAIREFQKDVSGVFAREGGRMIRESCSCGCPLGIIPQTVASLFRDGAYEKAYRHIAEHSPMPWVCAESCRYPCSDSCRLVNLWEDPLDVRKIEREVVDRGEPAEFDFTKPAFDKVAVIGGGPAGIVAAFTLRKAGYRPVIFEKRDRLGGAASWGISDSRLDKKKYHEEIDRLIGTGIEVRYGYGLGENFSLQQIRKEGFAAIILAVGKSEPEKSRVAGQNCRGVFEAVDILREINDGGLSEKEEQNAPAGLKAMGERVVVIGSGDVAIDTVQLLCETARQVTCIRQTEEETEALPPQVLRALEDAGAEYLEVGRVRQIISDPDGVKAVEITSDGRATNLFCDAVVLAAGRRCGAENIINAAASPDGCIRVDTGHRTNKTGVYACGEMTGESRSLAEAMAAGRAAAETVDADLRGAQTAEEEEKFLRAPAGETIYPENIVKQGQTEAVGEPGREAASSEILPVLRGAGIAEKMPVYFRDEGPEEEAGYKKVAVVGGGIAGITAAVSLAKKGIRPTIFEKTSRLGGSCRWLATNRRYDRSVLDREMKKIEESGIRVIYNTSGGVRPDILKLLREYDAVLFAIGETRGKKPDIPGIGARGVYDIISLMQLLNGGGDTPEIGRRAVVAGSDDISVDAARALKRICDDVTLLSDCGRGKLQIKTGAVSLLLNEGINIVTGVSVAQINEKQGKVTSVTCNVLENGSTLGVPCDTVVFGEGKCPDVMTISLKNLYLDLDEKGYIKTNSRLMASMRGVFAVGDFNMSSIDAGKAAADAVACYLNGDDKSIVVERFRPEEMAIEHERIQGSRIPKEERSAGITPLSEAMRCIDCGYHKPEESRCIGCGICMRYCPVGAIWMQGLS